MKRLILPLLAFMLIFASCGENNTEGGGTGNNAAGNTGTDTQMRTTYDEGGLSFEIPESWQKNFKAVTRDAGSSGDTYPQTDFYYTEGERDIRLMSIGKFTSEQWDRMKRDGQVGDDAILGNSKDNNHIYSIFYENHDYIKDEPLREKLGKIKTDAEKIREKMTIK